MSPVHNDTFDARVPCTRDQKRNRTAKAVLESISAMADLWPQARVHQHHAFAHGPALDLFERQRRCLPRHHLHHGQFKAAGGEVQAVHAQHQCSKACMPQKQPACSACTLLTARRLYAMDLMAVGLNEPSARSGPSSSDAPVVITPPLSVPATTVPTPGTPNVSSMMNVVGSRACTAALTARLCKMGCVEVRQGMLQQQEHSTHGQHTTKLQPVA